MIVLEPVVRVAGGMRVELQRQAAIRWLPGAESTEELPDALANDRAVLLCPGTGLRPFARSACVFWQLNIETNVANELPLANDDTSEIN